MITFTARKQLGSFQLDATFTAPPGGITAIFGRSGAGKTTIINLVAGILQPDQGRIAVGGTVFCDTAGGISLPPERRRVGFVFQDSRLFPHLSVDGNLRFGLTRAREASPRLAFDAVVRVLGVGHLLSRRPQSLSGGERQRVALGRALLAQPRILLMDEPLASLDGLRKADILPYIERLRDEFAIPIIYVSHALDEVIRLADSLVVVSDGRVAASGPLTEILSRLDLQPLLGRFEAGAVLDCRVASHDAHYRLSTLEFDGGRLRVPRVDRPAGEQVRVRLRARDISLALSEPVDVSITNRLAGTVTAVVDRDGIFVEVAVAIGGSSIRALVSREAYDRLGLEVGRPVWALIKTVALDNRSLGLLRTPRREDA